MVTSVRTLKSHVKFILDFIIIGDLNKNICICFIQSLNMILKKTYFSIGNSLKKLITFYLKWNKVYCPELLGVLSSICFVLESVSFQESLASVKVEVSKQRKFAHSANKALLAAVAMFPIQFSEPHFYTHNLLCDRI